MARFVIVSFRDQLLLLLLVGTEYGAFSETYGDIVVASTGSSMELSLNKQPRRKRAKPKTKSQGQLVACSRNINTTL